MRGLADIAELTQTCHRRPAFCGIAFRARELQRQLMKLDLNGCANQPFCFLMFFSEDCFYSCPETESTFS